MILNTKEVQSTFSNSVTRREKNRRGHSEAVSAIRTTAAFCSPVLVTNKVRGVCVGGCSNFWSSVSFCELLSSSVCVFLDNGEFLHCCYGEKYVA